MELSFSIIYYNATIGYSEVLINNVLYKSTEFVDRGTIDKAEWLSRKSQGKALNYLKRATKLVKA